MFFGRLKSEHWVLRLVRLGLLVLVPCLLMLLMIAGHPRGLLTGLAADHAQLARHVADGEGFVTSNVRPLSLRFNAAYSNHPDLYNAPAHPYALSWVYQFYDSFKSVTGKKQAPDRNWFHSDEDYRQAVQAQEAAETRTAWDRLTAVAGALLWIASVWLTYWVARRWWSAGTALLAATFYGCQSTAVIVAAIGGLPEPLTAIAVLLAVWVGTPNFTRHDDVGRNLPWWRVGLAGMACALGVLTDYHMLAFAVVFGIYVASTQRDKIPAVGLFVAGFVVAMAPWMWRNWQTTGSPVFTLASYEIVANTPEFPGESVWRMTEVPDNPFWFALGSPLTMIEKLLSGSELFYHNALVLNPLVVILFLVAIFSFRSRGRWRRFLLMITMSMLAVMLTSSLLLADARILAAWMPVLSIGAAVFLTEWVTRGSDVSTMEVVTTTESSDEPPPVPSDHEEPREKRRKGRLSNFFAAASSRSSPLGRALIFAAAVVTAAVPLAFLIHSSWAPSENAALAEYLRPLTNSKLRENAVVMTDRPDLMAWYGRRTAVWLCRGEGDLKDMERVVGPVDAFYTTSAIGPIMSSEQNDWWLWLATPRGIYDGMEASNDSPPNTTWRERPTQKGKVTP